MTAVSITADALKPVSLLRAPGWPPAGKPARAARAATDAVTAMLGQVTAHPQAARTVGCFVNTVPTAVAVTGQLRTRTVDDRLHDLVD